MIFKFLFLFFFLFLESRQGRGWGEEDRRETVIKVWLPLACPLLGTVRSKLLKKPEGRSELRSRFTSRE